MNFAETARVLAFAQVFDQRTVGESDVIAWQGLLVDAAFEDAQEAVKRHYQESAHRVMPVHVLNLVRVVEAERRARERDTGWAAGQAGVRRDGAYPEISGPIDDSNMPEDVKAKLRELLTERFGPSDREKLKPRTVFWEREHRAHVRVHEPNPLYRPRVRVCRGAVCEAEPCVLRDGGECSGA